jgi:hypothetical protein
MAGEQQDQDDLAYFRGILAAFGCFYFYEYATRTTLQVRGGECSFDCHHSGSRMDL